MNEQDSGGPAEQKASGYSWYVLGVLVLVYILNFIDRQILSILAVDIKADLVTRDAGPDLWLGTADKFLIRGSYCDYSGNIPQWDYFEDFAKKGLLEALASFKQSL